MYEFLMFVGNITLIEIFFVIAFYGFIEGLFFGIRNPLKLPAGQLVCWALFGFPLLAIIAPAVCLFYLEQFVKKSLGNKHGNKRVHN